ncbi:MAG: hypothetical protein NTV31_01960 [Bacteroidia bacterium]|nr:hypothetical protein [Bacteroidia bacterium]
MKELIKFIGLGCLIISCIFHSCKKDTLPTLTTSAITNITGTSATSGGTITDEGSGTVIFRGVCWSTGITPTIADNKTQDGAGAGSFTSIIIGLNGATTYYVKAYATNNAGTGYGMAMSFTTFGQVPTAITKSATNITTTAAILNAMINANYLSTNVIFEYGISTSYGQTITYTQNPVLANTNNDIYANISGLTKGTTYHFRIRAVNSLGTVYGDDMTFTTLIDDIEGNTYKTIKIGNQVWMAENLKTTKYRNGDSIGTTTPATLDISAEITPKYQWAYNGNESNVAIYGRLYSWYAVIDSRNICPTGWHVPSEPEWSTLTDFLKSNGYGYGGTGSDIAKAIAATSGWLTSSAKGTVGNDQASNNSSGFSALPGGYFGYGTFSSLGSMGEWWSSTVYDISASIGKQLNYGNSGFGGWIAIYNHEGVSVRCIKD